MLMYENSETYNILSNQNYLTPSRYISGRIVEYDIRSANISILRTKNIISEDEYINLYNMPKKQREIEIGLKIKNDSSIYESIKEGIKEARLELGKSNIINPDSIVRIANDAVYINSNIDLKNTKFGNYVEFRKKSAYNIMIQLYNIIIFLAFLPDGNLDIDVKGLGEENIKLHEDYILYTIISTIVIKERSGTIAAISYLTDICEKYIHYNLPVGYYREFNSESSYRLKYTIPGNTVNMTRMPGYNLGINNVSEYDKNSLDINYNYSVLRELWSILIEFYNIGR